MWLYFKLAWRNIWRNKRRTLITVASIMFAVFFAGSMRSLQEGGYARMISNAVNFYTGYGQIQTKKFWEEKSLNNSFLSNKEFFDLESKHKELISVVPRIESFALCSSEDVTKGAMVLGIDPEREKSLTKVHDRIVAGSYLNADDKAVLLGEGLAKFLKLDVGDTLVMIGQGYHGANAAGKYPVKGIFKFPLPQLNKQAVFLPLKEAQWLYAAENRLTSLALILEKPEKGDKAFEAIKADIDNTEYVVKDWKEMMPEILQQVELDRSSGKAMLFILYVIIGFGIFGTILMMTAERRKEFGVLLSIGMKRLRLIGVTWLEIVMLGLLGAIAGLAVTFPFCLYFYYNPIEFTGDMTKTYENFGIEPIIPTSIDWHIFANQALWVFLITSILAIYPLYTLWKMKPVDAMRS